MQSIMLTLGPLVRYPEIKQELASCVNCIQLHAHQVLLKALTRHSLQSDLTLLLFLAQISLLDRTLLPRKCQITITCLQEDRMLLILILERQMFSHK